MDRSIAAEILLLTADERGRLHRNDGLVALVGGARLVDLALAGAIAIDSDEGGDAVIRVLAQTDATADLQEEPALTPEIVSGYGSIAYDAEVERLLARGILFRDHTRIFGIVPRVRVRLTDRQTAADAREHLRLAASGREPMDRRAATVVALLHGADLLDRVVGGSEARAAYARVAADTTGERVAAVLRSISLVAGAASAAATAAAASTVAAVAA